MLTKEQLNEVAKECADKLIAWLEDDTAFRYECGDDRRIGAIILVALERVQRETASHAVAAAWSERLEDPPDNAGDEGYQAGIADATSAIRRAFGLADEPKEEPRG